MAETVTPFKFDEAKFKSHLASIKEEQLKFTGKHNHNPFLWIANNVRPIETRFDKGERSEELYKLGTELKSIAPRVNPDITDAVADATPAIALPVNPVQLPQGLKLPEKK